MTLSDNTLDSRLSPLSMSIWTKPSRYFGVLAGLWLLTFGMLFASEYGNHDLMALGAAVTAVMVVSMQLIMSFATHRIFTAIMRMVC